MVGCLGMGMLNSGRHWQAKSTDYFLAAVMPFEFRHTTIQMYCSCWPDGAKSQSRSDRRARRSIVAVAVVAAGM